MARWKRWHPPAGAGGSAASSGAAGTRLAQAAAGGRARSPTGDRRPRWLPTSRGRWEAEPGAAAVLAAAGSVSWRFAAWRGLARAMLKAPARGPPPVPTTGGDDVKGQHLATAADTRACAQSRTQTCVRVPGNGPSSGRGSGGAAAPGAHGCGERGWERAVRSCSPSLAISTPPVLWRDAACAARLFTPGCSCALTFRV